MRTSLKARIAAAKVNGQLQSAEDQMNANSAMAAFERMEEKVLQIQARSQAEELSGADLEAQFWALESGDVDLELEAMKQQMLAGLSVSQQSPPLEAASTGQQIGIAPKDAAIDSELEDLKKQLEQL